MLMAEWRQDFVRTFLGRLGEIAPAEAEKAFAELRASGEDALLRDGFVVSQGTFAFAADLRYRGQEHTIPIAVGAPSHLVDDIASTVREFNRQHDNRYGHAAPDQQIEIVNLRLVVTVPRADDGIERLLSEPWVALERADEGRRAVVFDDPSQPLEARILWRPALPAGTEVVGPAVIEEPNSTILIPPGDRAVVDPSGHLIITLANAAESSS
jgi:N-methylhydantoinase A